MKGMIKKREVKREMTEEISENLKCFFGIISYGSIKSQQELLEYLRRNTDLKLIFDKRSIDHLYICFEDPRKPKQAGGEKQ